MLITLVLLVGVAGCGSTDPPTKAAGDNPPITLTAVTPGLPGFPGDQQLAEFARQVADLSGGSINIDTSATLESGGGRDQKAVEMVRNGEVDLGLVPARIFDVMGVKSLRALQAPFLVDSNELADQVLADPLADEMLAGLDSIGLTGLALMFESLRQPTGNIDPLLAPADFAGKVISAPPGETVASVFEALGAEVTNAVDAELTVGIFNGTIQGSDASIQVPSPVATGPVTGNAALYVKANAIFVDSNTFSGLTADQRDILRRAAVNTREWASRQHPDVVNSAAAYCSKGYGDVVLASTSQLAALRAATAPVDAELRKDEFTRSAIERIEDLKATLPQPPVIAACTSAASDRAQSTETADATTAPAGIDDQTAVDGTWRFEIDLDPNADRPDAARQAALNNGTWTYIYNNGHSRSIENTGNTHDGTYEIHGNIISGVDDDGVRWSFVFDRDGDTMTLAPVPGTMDPVDEELERAFYANPLQRVGDPDIEPGNQG
jgi:TRAP-type C4-dicarboxylate transport system substrate-binding protein